MSFTVKVNINAYKFAYSVYQNSTQLVTKLVTHVVARILIEI